MSKTPKLRFGIPADLCKTILTLNKIVPHIAEEMDDRQKKRWDTRRKKRDLDRIKELHAIAKNQAEEHGITVPIAVKRMLASGYPHQDRRTIQERYRKSKERQERAAVQFIRGEDATDRSTRMAYRIDSALTEGVPTGPVLGDVKRLIWDAGRFAALIAAEKQQLCPLDDVRIRTLASGLSQESGLRVSPIALAYFFGAYAATNLVTPESVRDLCGVHAYIPLDCDNDTIGKCVAAIAAEWRTKRQEVRGSEYPTNRDTSHGKIEKLEHLPGRLQTFIPPERPKEYTTPRPAVQQSSADLLTALCDELVQELSKALPEYADDIAEIVDRVAARVERYQAAQKVPTQKE
jgi:hypothetical protein